MTAHFTRNTVSAAFCVRCGRQISRGRFCAGIMCLLDRKTPR